jgi:hypothetical protein
VLSLFDMSDVNWRRVRHTGERLDAHLFVAGLVALHVTLLIWRVTKYHAAHLKLVRLAGSLGILLLVQLLLGVGSYFAKFITLLQLPMDMVVFLTTTHLIVGALMLVTSLALTIHSYRLSERRSQRWDQTHSYRGC